MKKFKAKVGVEHRDEIISHCVRGWAFVGYMAIAVATAAIAQTAAADIQHLGETAAGIDLTVGPDSGIVSCRYDQVTLESKVFENGITRLRIYFHSLDTSSGSGTSHRINCILRLKEAHEANTKLTIVGARILGVSELDSSMQPRLGFLVSSMGATLASGNVILGSNEIRSSTAIDGMYRQELISGSHSTRCFDRDQSGLFGINLAASVTGGVSESGFFSMERLDIYLKEESCQ